MEKRGGVNTQIEITCTPNGAAGELKVRNRRETVSKRSSFGADAHLPPIAPALARPDVAVRETVQSLEPPPCGAMALLA